MKRTAGGVSRADTVSVPSVDLTGEKESYVHVILVSAQGPNPSFFPFWRTFILLGILLGQGLGLGPGLDNSSVLI